MTEETSKKVTTEETSSIDSDSSIAPYLIGKAPKFWQGFLSVWLSRKLVMTLIAIGINWAAYWTEVKYLYSFLIPEQIVAFSAMTRDFHWTLTASLLAYLGVQGALSWKHGTETALTQAVSHLGEKSEKKEEVTQNINYNQHIIEEGVGNASETRPFSQSATHEEGLDE